MEIQTEDGVTFTLSSFCVALLAVDDCRRRWEQGAYVDPEEIATCMQWARLLGNLT